MRLNDRKYIKSLAILVGFTFVGMAFLSIPLIFLTLRFCKEGENGNDRMVYSRVYDSSRSIYSN